MTKPAPPSAGENPAKVVEIDAIDGAEWERDQYTPRAPTAGLAALVRQTLPQPSTAEPQQRPAPPSHDRAPPRSRAALPPPRGPVASRTSIAATAKRAGAAGAADAPGAPGAPGAPAGATEAPGTQDIPGTDGEPITLPRVPPAASNDRPTAHAVVRQIAAQVRGAGPLANNTRPLRQPRVEPDEHAIAPSRVPPPANEDRTIAPPPPSSLMNDDPDLLPVQVIAPASDTRPLRHPRVEPPESDDRDLDRMISSPRVSPFASTERITAPPLASSQPVQQRRLEPSPWPPVHPSPMPLSRVPLEAKNAPGASSDAMPAQNRLSRAASSLRMDGMGSLAALSWVSSHRGVVIGGAGLTVILLLIAFAATRGSDPDTSPAMPATAIHAGPQSATGSPAPAHDAATSPPSTRDKSAAGAAVPTTSPASPSAPSPASPVSPPGLRNPAKIIALSSPPRDTPAETADDVPETERARAAYNEGNHALFVGNSDAAIRAYRQALSAAPTFPPGFRGLGLAYAQKGQNGLAIMSLRTYLTKAPHAKDAALIKQRIAALQSSNP